MVRPCNTFNGLHGRTLPVATGIRLANHEMLVIAVAGDGDCYGEGGNHLMHPMRRNILLRQTLDIPKLKVTMEEFY